MTASMRPADALSAIYVNCREPMLTERSIVLSALKQGRKDLRKAAKARGILEACLREIHTIDPAHKSHIECAWVALQRLDEE